MFFCETLVQADMNSDILTARVNNMGEGECLTLYRVVKNDCMHSKGFLSDM